MVFCAQRTRNLSRKKSDRNVKNFFLIFTFFDSVFSLLRIHPEDITLKTEKAKKKPEKAEIFI